MAIDFAINILFLKEGFAVIFCIITLLLFLFLAIENKILLKIKKSIPVRIHVFGTRGKTTLTCEIYNHARITGLRIMGKTTGDVPLLLYPDGHKKILKRYGPARIREYIKCLKLSSQLNCNAVVFECMAITPETIIAANKILSPTHVLITNTRPDHHETMGIKPEDIAKTIALCVNSNSKNYIINDENSEYIHERAKLIGADYVSLDCETGVITPIVNALAADLQLPRCNGSNLQLSRFIKYHHPSVGTFSFLDIFSTNDTVSSEIILNSAMAQVRSESKNGITTPLIAIFSTRCNRPLRTIAFIDWMVKNNHFIDCYILGDHAAFARISMMRHSKSSLGSFFYIQSSPVKLLMNIRARYGENSYLVGIGNAHGYGEKFREFICKDTTPCY